VETVNFLPFFFLRSMQSTRKYFGDVKNLSVRSYLVFISDFLNFFIFYLSPNSIRVLHVWKGKLLMTVLGRGTIQKLTQKTSLILNLVWLPITNISLCFLPEFERTRLDLFRVDYRLASKTFQQPIKCYCNILPSLFHQKFSHYITLPSLYINGLTQYYLITML